MSKKESLKTRAEIDPKYTWDLTVFFSNETEFNEEVSNLKSNVDQFVKDFPGKINQPAMIVNALHYLEKIYEQIDLIENYAYLDLSVDLTDASKNQRMRQVSDLEAEIAADLTFFEDELLQNEDEMLDKVSSLDPNFSSYIRHAKAQKSVQLAPEAEKILSQLAPTVHAPENIYGQVRSADMDFGTFNVNGQDYPLSFVLYEDFYAYHPNTDIRRAAFEKFSEVLARYQNTVAVTYYTQVSTEKKIATMRGFDSVIDYLLYDQEVDRSLFDRQIDIIIEKLGPIMQKYITFLKKQRGLDEMTYADLKIDLDPDFNPIISIEDAKKYVSDALITLGADYQDMILKSYPERWIDFVQNVGKETGGFCAQPYKKQPRILMSWTNQLADVYTLIHELGHAGQGILSSEKNSVLGFNPSTYIVEAPSTFNELLLTHSIEEKATDPRMKRFALTKMLANTYFHNFITHLLEAAYQREVYDLIDQGQGFDA